MLDIQDLASYNLNVVSKETYYQRKKAGLCTKCGKSREGSPSKARCLACHQKLKDREKKKSQIVVDEINDPMKNSGSIENFKKNTILSNKNDKECNNCGESIDFHILFCQKCIKLINFSKEDAISRYDNKCAQCSDTTLSKLKIVSSSVDVALKYKDQELYKRICYRKIPPTEYEVMCHSCYWRENISYIKDLRAIFDQEGVFDDILSDDNVIDLS